MAQISAFAEGESNKGFCYKKYDNFRQGFSLAGWEPVDLVMGRKAVEKKATGREYLLKRVSNEKVFMKKGEFGTCPPVAGAGFCSNVELLPTAS
jgi:hypothetical protein